MIINLPTIANKRLVSNPDGSQIMELGESVFVYNKQAVVNDVITVTRDQAGKPWLISQLWYQNESSMAALFFLNGYSNPYSVDEGDKILIFDTDTINNVIRDNNTINKEFFNVKPQETVQKSSKVDKSTKIDQARQSVLSKLGTTPEVTVAPNESTGAPKTTAVDGLITLGTDVSDTRCKSTNLTDTQTRTEQIRAAIKKKLGVTTK